MSLCVRGLFKRKTKQVCLLFVLEREKNYKQCVQPCSFYITRDDEHDVCVICLGAEHA